jgi:NRPS condensation-like uncharacterized protein
MLPLPLSPFEQYMLIDDRPAYPMTFWIRLNFAGRLHQEHFLDALRQALARHPLLFALVRNPAREQFEWVPAAQEPRLIWLARDEAGRHPVARGIDLYREPGLRTWVVEVEDETAVWLQFHHACCDGFGSLRFVEDLLVAYDHLARAAAGAANFRPLDSRRLRGRANFLGQFLRRLPQQATGLFGVRDFLGNRPMPLLPEAGNETRICTATATAPAMGWPSYLSAHFSHSETTALKAESRARRVSVNDLLARDLFLALDSFRGEHAEADRRQCLRISVPVNLRRAADQESSAANLVSMVFLDRRKRDFADPAALLEDIHQQMNRVKRRRLGLTFVLVLALFRQLGMLRKMVQDKQCAATTVLTNMPAPLADAPLPRREGQIVAGNVELQRIEALPPLRPFTTCTFSAHSYAGQLTLTGCFDERLLGPTDGGILLNLFAARVRASAGAISELAGAR